MGDEACSVIRTNNPNLSNYEIDQLINSWDASKSAFENLLNTTWTFDPLVYENVPQYLGLKSNFNYERYNKLQLLSDKVLFSNLSTGFKDTGPSAGRNCSPGYIQLKYLNTDGNINFLENSGSNSSMFKARLIVDTDDVPNESNLWIKVTADPILSEDSVYESIPDEVVKKSTIRTSNSQPPQGLKLKLEINFEIKSCGSVTERLKTNRYKISYWSRMMIRNMCEIDNSLLSNHAVLAKCLKYKSGIYNNNIKNIYNNLIVTAAKSKNIIRTDNFNGHSCSDRNSTTLRECNNTDADSVDEMNKRCARSLNCEWDSTFSNSMGSSDSSTCPSQGNKCLLSDLQTTKNLVDRIEQSMGLYYSYSQHRNPYNSAEISEFGADCDADIINQIENVCFDKNIGISFRFEPVSCTPGHPQFNPNTCKSNCYSNGKCTTPVLVSEPDLSAFKCTLEGIDQLENYCKKINDSIVDNPNYYNLGFTQAQIQLPGYNPDNYPYTGCNESMVESHLLYIRSLIMGELEQINNNINSIIENNAQVLNDYSRRRSERMGILKLNITQTQSEIVRINENVLATMKRIGTVNNDYNRVKANIIDFNNSLDLRFEKKKLEFKVVVFFSILVINILIILIFFRKK